MLANRVSTMAIFWKIISVQFLVAFHYLQPISSHSPNSRPAIKLEDIVPAGYDSFQTPMIDGNPTDVSIKIEILNIRAVKVVDMSFIGDIFLYKTWRDTRLQYPSNLTQHQISLNPGWRKNMWTPDVYFHNALEGKVQDTIIPYVFLWLRNDSTVVFGARLSLLFSCDMTLHYFPHDVQECDIVVKSLTHSLTEMNLHWSQTEDPLTIGDIFLLPQFDYDPPVPTECKESNSEVERIGKFACLRALIKLTRRTGYYVINIYIPTILIVFMSMLTFWIPPEAVPGRVTLGVTSLLTIITKQYQASLPNVSYVIALNIWLLFCIGFVFCSLLEYAAVIALHSHNKRVHSETNLTPTDKVLSLNGKADKPWWSRANDKIFTWIESQSAHTIDRTSRVVFPVAFVFQCICYWAYYANTK